MISSIAVQVARQTSNPVFGASLLSAAASLPLHLLPLLILAVVHEGRLTPAQAGWIGSAYMLGQLSTVLFLPAMNFRRVVSRAACLSLVLLLSATAMSDSSNQAFMLLCWLFIGNVCGSFHFLATTTAATDADPRWAFAVRMAMSSFVGACVIVFLQVSRGNGGYALLSGQLMLAFAVVAGLGLLLYRTPPLAPTHSGITEPATRSHSVMLRLGFIALFILFVGQHGLWAFAVQGAQQRGLALEQVMWAIAVCKLAGSATVLLSGMGGRKRINQSSLFLLSISVALGATCVAMATHTAVFWFGLLFWEVGFNVLSARLQGILAQQNPTAAGKWMSSAIFLGAASGPALAGLTISLGLFQLFAVFGVASALIPWVWTVARPQHAKGRPLQAEPES